MELNNNILVKLASSKIAKDHVLFSHKAKQVLCADFSYDGSRLVTADSTSLNIYDINNGGKKIKTLFLKTKQIQIVKMTHNIQAVICATKKDYQILYWSIYQNQIVKLFKGHKDQICCLDLCPTDDTFLSTSRDQTLRLWDLASMSYQCQAILDLSQKSCGSYPVASFDNMGMIFAVAFTQNIGINTFSRICLYGKTQYQQEGAFETWSKDCPQIKLLKFSNCGSYILCGTSQNLIILLDAFKGTQKQRFTNFFNQNSIIQCSMSPDCRYIASGSENGIVHIWQIQTGQKVVQLNQHIQKCDVVKFSPIQMLLVTAGRVTIWWIPRQ